MGASFVKYYKNEHPWYMCGCAKTSQRCGKKHRTNLPINQLSPENDTSGCMRLRSSTVQLASNSTTTRKG